MALIHVFLAAFLTQQSVYCYVTYPPLYCQKEVMLKCILPAKLK